MMHTRHLATALALVATGAFCYGLGATIAPTNAQQLALAAGALPQNVEGGRSSAAAIDQTGGDSSDLAITTITPERLLDTRPTEPSLVDSSTPFGAAESRSFAVAGLGSTPVEAEGVVLNITALNATSDTYLTVYPTGSTRPLASTMNPTVGQTSFNAATVLLGAGSFDVYNNGGSVDVIIDVAGYLTPDLKQAVNQLQAGELLPLPPSFRGVNYPTPLFTDWRGLTGQSARVSAVTFGVQVSSDRYPNAEAVIEAVLAVPPATNTVAKPVQMCLRAALLDGGAIPGSEFCVVPDNPTFTEDGVDYFLVTGPRFALPSGTMYHEIKTVAPPGKDANFYIYNVNFRVYSD